MAGHVVDTGATGDVAIAFLRRNGTIGVPVYVWLGAQWVDFKDLTPQAFSAWVDQRVAGLYFDPAQPDVAKVEGFTISRTNDW